jgi:mRNA-degrading endonuclease RelE of RelBE toxin-antitoxin system
MPRTLEMRKSALSYFERLDQPTQKRVREKLQTLLTDPMNIQHSKPLAGADKRSSRVGSYRILFLVTDEVILITDIDSRGDVYKSIR